MDSFDIAQFIRTNIWLEALDGIRRYPLFGVGAMGYLHLSELHKYYHSHNMLLEMLISFGIVGTDWRRNWRPGGLPDSQRTDRLLSPEKPFLEHQPGPGGSFECASWRIQFCKRAQGELPVLD
jgi:hypothetical protein